MNIQAGTTFPDGVQFLHPFQAGHSRLTQGNIDGCARGDNNLCSKAAVVFVKHKLSHCDHGKSEPLRA
jgi:hypothetical protein